MGAPINVTTTRPRRFCVDACVRLALSLFSPALLVHAAIAAAARVYRLHNASTATHFYPISHAERDNVGGPYQWFAPEDSCLYAFTTHLRPVILDWPLSA